MSTITASAPGRCGIVGNPTDMYGGSVLSCTTRERAACTITMDTDSFHVENGAETAVFHGVEELTLRNDNLDIARAALLYFGINPAITHFSMRLSTTLPMRAGLAGSTAMLTAIVGALNTFLDLNRNPYALAETIRKIEARLLGILCGFQDQHMAVFGGINYMEFAGKESLEQKEEEPLAVVEPLINSVRRPPLLLAHTGVQHHSGTVHKSPRQRWLEGEKLVRESYARIAKLTPIAKRALIEQDWGLLGSLMNENHSIASELGGSGPENDRLIQAARKAGAYGAKLAGAGGGGTIIALTDKPEHIAAALTSAGAEQILTPEPAPGLTVNRC